MRVILDIYGKSKPSLQADFTAEPNELGLEKALKFMLTSKQGEKNFMNTMTWL